MGRLFFISIVSILFIISCKKVEENPTYKIELSNNQVFKKNQKQVWRDTIFYSISGTIEENYRFVLVQSSNISESFDDNSYSKSQYVEIVEQTPNYLIYQVNPESSSSSSSYKYASLFLIANGEVIDNVDLSIKFVTSSSNNNGTDDGWLIYKSGSSTIKKYDFGTSLSSSVYSSSSTIYDLKISPDAQNLAYSTYSSIYYRTITGGYINSHSSAYPGAIGFTSSNDLFYIDGNYHYQYTNIANSTNKNYTYISGLRDFVSASNSYYYNINYSSGKLYIKQGNASTLYSSYNTLSDITIDDQNKILLFVEDGTKLKKLDLNSNSVTTLYSVSSSNEIKNPDFNQDGTKIAFVIENKGYGDIYTMSVNGNNVVNLTNTSSVDEDLPNWK